MQRIKQKSIFLVCMFPLEQFRNPVRKVIKFVIRIDNFECTSLFTSTSDTFEVSLGEKRHITAVRSGEKRADGE